MIIEHLSCLKLFVAHFGGTVRHVQHSLNGILTKNRLVHRLVVLKGYFSFSYATSKIRMTLVAC